MMFLPVDRKILFVTERAHNAGLIGSLPDYLSERSGLVQLSGNTV
jgi:hypothetical protein